MYYHLFRLVTHNSIWKGIQPKVKLAGEQVEIMDREVEQLKQSRIPIVRVCWNSRISSPFH